MQTLTGTLDKIKYALKTKFNGGVETTLETTTSDGTKFTADWLSDLAIHRTIFICF